MAIEVMPVETVEEEPVPDWSWRPERVRVYARHMRDVYEQWVAEATARGPDTSEDAWRDSLDRLEKEWDELLRQIASSEAEWTGKAEGAETA